MSTPTRTFSEPPKQADGTYDKVRIKELYNDSQFIEWGEFCRSMNWNSKVVRRSLPFKGWKASKIKRLEKEAQEEWADINANHEVPLRTKRLKVVRDYPELFEQVRLSLVYELNLIRQDQFLASTKTDHIRRYNQKDLDRVIKMMNQTARGHYTVLGITEDSLAKAKEPLKAMDAANEKEQGQTGFVFELASGKNASVEEIAKEASKWYDKPMDTQLIDVPKIENPTFSADPDQADESYFDDAED